MKAKTARVTFLFVQPLDSQTNGVINEFLSRQRSGQDEGAVTVELGRELRKRECSFSEVNQLVRSRHDGDLRFKVFRQRGRNGQLEEVKFQRGRWTFAKAA